ncbi:pseudaminic acid biosynthesis-associated methylase [Saliterribacillus persicus]|uniref:Pseudaminic acid biosynthesis-associated methylase n=1 Tax=Saliterribacillus persicus TaxID=930114 RepID=A0A368YDE3_9BACI|nr:pseudaminic acid biosynthesis-associated methylase [Saliterribacillus persicus]RCW77356.1 pseudaminic acid biosynthesis-associated methylase [Saliterribacillus persicus]
MPEFKTEQEKFWAGEFGKNYINRNTDYLGNIPLFSKIFSKTNNVTSIIELGANIGLNLKAIKTVLPNTDLSAVEISSDAVKELEQIEDLNVYNESLLDFNVDYKRDFVLIKGVLIHINPDFLDEVYDLLYNLTDKYICIAEYYNPTPVGVNYRGHEDKLFKRDFAGEVLDKFDDLELVDYGFVYHRDNNFPQDDITWFLLKKTR